MGDSEARWREFEEKKKLNGKKKSRCIRLHATETEELSPE